MRFPIGAKARWSDEGLQLLMPATRRLSCGIGIIERVNEDCGTVTVNFGRTAKSKNRKDVKDNIRFENVVLVEWPDPPSQPPRGSVIEIWVKWALDRIDYRAAVACERIRQAAN
jgi:hypothetical protein